MAIPPLRIGWVVALSVSAGLGAVAVAAPVVGGEAGHWMHAAFSSVCHQLADRSPHVAGGPIALCHRCSGILGGLVLGLAAAPLLGRSLLAATTTRAQGVWLVLAVLPTALDWALGTSGLWANTPASRTLTGAVFGLVAGGVLAANLLTARPARAPALTPTL
ncbi:DUF2085 domain-containing protein [Rubrivirga sp. IMCC45206]|uniref:DUF2085 domain-containing protein n=1 Tax=Rubrivirga sp. IMCC45206 TaxID=3391614 RepID=UPI00398F9D4D